MSCLFCRIAQREIPASVVYEDDHVLAFNDINPQAPTHVLIIPKRHIDTLNDLTPEDDALVGELVRRAGRPAPGPRGAAGGVCSPFNTKPRPGGAGSPLPPPPLVGGGAPLDPR